MEKILTKKLKELEETNEISADEVLSLESLVYNLYPEREQFITKDTPIHKFTMSRSSNNVDKVILGIKSLLSDESVDKKLDKDSLYSRHKRLLDINSYYDDVLNYLGVIKSIGEETINVLKEFKYTRILCTDEQTWEDKFITIGKEVALIKALNDTTLKDIIPYYESILNKAIPEDAIKSDLNQYSDYDVNTIDITLSLLMFILRNDKIEKEERDIELIEYKNWNIGRLLHFIFNPDKYKEVFGFNGSVKTAATIEDILTIREHIDYLINIVTKMKQYVYELSDNSFSAKLLYNNDRYSSNTISSVDISKLIEGDNIDLTFKSLKINRTE